MGPKKRSCGCSSTAGKNTVTVKRVPQKELKGLAKSKNTTRVGATVNIKRRVADYKRNGVAKGSTIVYHSSSTNMKKAENILLKKCKGAKACKKNSQAKSNVPSKKGDVYVIKSK